MSSRTNHSDSPFPCCDSYASLFLALASVCLHAEGGYDAWLRYTPLEAASRAKYQSLPASVKVIGDSAVLQAAESELIRRFRGMLGKALRDEKGRMNGDENGQGQVLRLESAQGPVIYRLKLYRYR